jgi:predicted Rossmann-fold nucleotide-binding protein
METSGFKKIAVFCGASMGNDEIYAAAAREMGKVLVSEGNTSLNVASNCC